MDQNRCLLDVIDNPQLLQSFLESESSAETNGSTSHTINNNNNPDNIDSNNLSTNISGATNNISNTIQHDSQTSSASTISVTTSIDSFSIISPSTHTSSSSNTTFLNTANSTSTSATSCNNSNRTFTIDKDAETSAATIIATGNSDVTDVDINTASIDDEYLRETVSLTTNELILDVAVKQDGCYNPTEVADASPLPRTLPPPEPSSAAAVTKEAGPLTCTSTTTSTTDTTAHLTTVNFNSSSSIENQNASPIDQQLRSSISNDVRCNNIPDNDRASQPSKTMEDLYSPHDINESVSLATDEIISKVSVKLEPHLAAPETDAQRPPASPATGHTDNTSDVKTKPYDVTDSSGNSQTQVENHNTFIKSEPSCLSGSVPSLTQPGDINFTKDNACEQPLQPNKVEPTLVGPALNNAASSSDTNSVGAISTNVANTTPTMTYASNPPTKSSMTPASSVTKGPVAKTPSATTAATTTAKTATKRAPAKRSTPAKKKAAAPVSTVSNATTPMQQAPVQTQFSSPQQMIYTSQNNSAIRQPAILANSPMTGIPQQQRVITINTPNGPMLFAIAPAPNMTNSPMMNQQPGMQSQQYPSQQVCFQPNSTVMLNRPQQGQQQSQQRIVIPPSQAMMIPRMPNQVVMNRPMTSPGTLMPGQQQFIQIQTPSGPMLLALAPQQQAQASANPTMIDYNNQMQQQHQQHQQQQQQQQQHQQSQQQQQQQQQQHQQHQHQQQQHHQQQQQQQQHQQQQQQQQQQQNRQQQQNDSADNSKNASSAKTGLDLADLLLDCGILPEDRTASTQSPGIVKASPSPSIPQIQSPMSTLTPMNPSMTPIDSLSLPTNSPQQPMHSYPGQQMPQQPVRFTLTPDGKMIMQPTIQYSTIQPVLANTIGQPHLNSVGTNSLVSTNTQMASMNPNLTTPTSETSATDNKKPAAKGKGTAKRSRSKKSDLDKFPTLKTPKIAQQQQQQQQHQQIQAVSVPQTVLVVDQNKVIATRPDVKPGITQLAGGQSVSLAKIVTPVIPTTFQPIVSSNMMQTSIPSATMLGSTIGQNQTSLSSVQNTQLVVSNSGSSINGPIMNTVQNQSNAIVGLATQTQAPNSTSQQQLNSSGNVTTNLLQKFNTTGTVESNPHISSSLMPHKTPLMVDTSKMDLRMLDGQQPNHHADNKGVQSNGGLTKTTTLVLHQPQAQPQHSVQHQMSQVQHIARQVDIRAQSILNQLGADQKAALNPQIEQSFKSLEDACKRLLRYHVFDTETVSEAQLKKVDELFEAAAESLLTRKKAIYDKYRLLILKQSMKTVPSSEEVMLEQIFVNDEQNCLKKDRELFREYEAQLEILALKQTRADSRLDSNKDDCAPDYFAFGENSPKQNNQDDLENVANSRDVDDWLLTDKWGKSHYPSVPDSEAATAIESILNDEPS